MLITRWKRTKNKKGVTLVEMLAAIAITAILASVLSMMIVPVMNTYSTTQIRVELSQAATGRLNDIALHLRGATGVYLSTVTRTVANTWKNGKGNYFSNTNTDKMPKEANYFLPEIRWYEKQSSESESVKSRRVEFDGVRTVATGSKRIYSFVMDNYYEQRKGKSDPDYRAGYLFPEMVVADWSNMQKRYLDYAGGFSMKLESDAYQTPDITCPDNQSMYFIPKVNPDDGNRVNSLEIHLIVQKGSVTFEAVKTIVCENLVINNEVICTNNFQTWSGNNLVKKAATKDTKYYTVWFTKLVV